MAHSRGEGGGTGGTGGTTPKPNPSASAGQTPSNMDLAHANRTTGVYTYVLYSMTITIMMGG